MRSLSFILALNVFLPAPAPCLEPPPGCPPALVKIAPHAHEPVAALDLPAGFVSRDPQARLLALRNAVAGERISASMLANIAHADDSPEVVREAAIAHLRLTRDRAALLNLCDE